ncbi:MAG: hypothetical protein KJ659_09095 [Actinobacteria bacterium]|nr:hypothetical protein [Actinomycetota bacterium]MBU1607821.1 hypothetical protein [Actinomycetota bacterium]MBU2314675.1 hypothetical protein [Actinomycetota bacterium]MBU2385636.1 hypothetical protein [Actinomycetota bacterium]
MRNAVIPRDKLATRLGLPKDATVEQIKASLTNPPGSAEPRATRKAFTDRLGLPQDATDEQVLAAVDAALAAADAAAAEDKLMRQAGWADSIGVRP